jgi:acetate kinase
MKQNKKNSRNKSLKKENNFLVLNVGSSSLKYALYEGEKCLLSDNIERVTSTAKRKKAVKTVFSKVKKYSSSLTAVVHRVVHGGDISKPVKIDNKVLKKLKKVAELAPLHDIPEIEVIEECKKNFSCPQVAVFDTAFHQTMPEKAKAYAIPYSFYRQGIKRYGFHGTSVAYVSRGLKGKVIVCHIGSGASITAVKNGKSVDTSMGFTPLDGIMMSTRSGSVDPGIVHYLVHHNHLSEKRVTDHILNKESGLLGVSGKSGDLRDLLKRKDKQSTLAVDMFIYRIIKKIGAYAAAMNGVDNIVFTAGVMERNSEMRKRVVLGLSYLGAKLDASKNSKARHDIKRKQVISSSFSKIKLYVIPTDEELQMVREAKRILK